jgi:hypothetical protein
MKETCDENYERISLMEKGGRGRDGGEAGGREGGRAGGREGRRGRTLKRCRII